MIEPSCVLEVMNTPGFNAMCDEYATHAIKSLPKPSFGDKSYLDMEKLGIMSVFRVMQEDAIVGFASLIKSQMPKYGVQITIAEGFFVMDKYRLQSVGIRLLETCEGYSKNSGSFGLFMNCPFGSRWKDVLLRRGYTHETECLFKPL